MLCLDEKLDGWGSHCVRDRCSYRSAWEGGASLFLCCKASDCFGERVGLMSASSLGVSRDSSERERVQGGKSSFSAVARCKQLVRRQKEVFFRHSCGVS